MNGLMTYVHSLLTNEIFGILLPDMVVMNYVN